MSVQAQHPARTPESVRRESGEVGETQPEQPEGKSLRTRCGWVCGVSLRRWRSAYSLRRRRRLWRRTRCQCVHWVSASAASDLAGLLPDVASACCALHSAQRSGLRMPICLPHVSWQSEPCQISCCCQVLSADCGAGDVEEQGQRGRRVRLKNLT